MHTTDGFPRDLLSQSKAARLAYFSGYTVAHPLLKEVDAKLWQALESPGDARLICLYGPTGIGKTTVIERVKQRLLEQAQALMEQDPGYLPVAGVAAVAADTGNFSWRDYYKRALEALDDPFYGHARVKFGKGVRWSGPEMRRALEKALEHRRVAAFIIDEAQHLTKMASGRRLQDQMDCIKSLAGVSGAAHVLAGTYELLAFRNLSAQLVRRSMDIHFHRYRADQEGEVKAWRNVVWAFERHLPLAEEPDLIGQWEYCFERALGCVGILKQWLLRALQVALEEDRCTIDLSLLEREALSATQCEKMVGEMLEGEGQLAEGQEARTRLRLLLGLPEGSGQQGGSTRKRKRVSGRVGQRKAGRDPIGGKQRAG
jgi:AAA domain-containing protein